MNIESHFLLGGAGLIPSKRYGAPDALMGSRFPDETWESFPLAQYVAHDKVFFGGNASYVEKEHVRDVLAWELALGVQMNASVLLGAGDYPPPSIFTYLDRLQKSICWRYMGAPLEDFRYLYGSGAHGVMLSQWGGGLIIIVNLSNRPYRYGTQAGLIEIAPDGFYATAGNARAGILTSYLGRRSPTGEIDLMDARTTTR